MQLLAVLLLAVFSYGGVKSDPPLVRYESFQLAGRSLVTIYTSGRVAHQEVDLSENRGPFPKDLAAEPLDGNMLMILQQLVSEIENQVEKGTAVYKRISDVPLGIGFNEGTLDVRLKNGNYFPLRKIYRHGSSENSGDITYLDTPEVSGLLKVFIYGAGVKFHLRLKDVDDTKLALTTLCQPLLSLEKK